MKTREVIDGLTLLEGYRDETSYDVGAEHDVIYAYPTDRPLSLDDVQRMIDLGWFQEDAEFVNEFSVKDYDPELSWACYV